jgi:hypothetical protein
MNESAFDDALNALVQGEQPETLDNLTRFAADLYRKELDVTMSPVTKNQIAASLQLEMPAPVSNRTRRERAALPARQRPRWMTAVTVALAALLALTGVFQWSMRTDNGDNRFGVLSPAVPTTEATPVATPPATAWMQPVKAEECPRDQLQKVSARTNPSATWYSQEDYDKVPDVVVYGPFSQANEVDADAVVTRMREITACELALVPNRTLQITSPRFEFESRTSEGRISVARRQNQRVEAAKDLSLFYQQELRLTPASLMIHHPNAELAERSFLPDGLNNFYNPAHAVELADGRVVVMMSMVGYGEEFPYDIAAEPTYVPPVFIFIEIDGQWYLDERMQLCIGECDAFWAEQESGTPAATPIIAVVEVVPMPVSAASSGDDVKVKPTPTGTAPPEIQPIDVTPTPTR